MYSGYERPNFFVRGFWNYYSDTTETIFNPLLAPFLQPIYRTGTNTNYFAANTYNIDAQHILELWPGNRLDLWGQLSIQHALKHARSELYYGKSAWPLRAG